MIYKVAFIGENQFQWNGEAIPLDEASLRSVIAQNASGSLLADQFIEKVKKEGSAEFKVTADKGVIVDMYEVEYPTPANPLKQTEELASHLDEKKDFVTQYVFPQTSTEDVLVDLRSKVEQRRQPKVPHAVASTLPKKKDKEVLRKKEEEEETKNEPLYPPEWYAGIDADESMAENTDEGAPHFSEGKLKRQAWQIIPQISEQEKQQILRTRRINYDKLKATYNMDLGNWVDVTVPYGGGGRGSKLFRAIIGYDIFRYLVAIQEGDDVTNTEVNYDDLVEDGKNPYDFKDVVAYAIENGPDETNEDTDLDTLAEGEEVVRLSSKRQAWQNTECEMHFAWDMNTAEYKSNDAGTDYDYAGAKRDAEEELRELLAESLPAAVVGEVKVVAEFRSFTVESINMVMEVIVRGPRNALELLQRRLRNERRIRAEITCGIGPRGAQKKHAWDLSAPVHLGTTVNDASQLVACARPYQVWKSSRQSSPEDGYDYLLLGSAYVPTKEKGDDVNGDWTSESDLAEAVRAGVGPTRAVTSLWGISRSCFPMKLVSVDWRKRGIQPRAWAEPLKRVPRVTPTDQWGERVVKRFDVHPAGKGRYFQFVRPIPYKQMVAGNIYGDSYSSTNTGCDVFTFLGYTDATEKYGAGGKAFDTIQEAFRKYGASSLAALTEKTRVMFQEYGHSVYMFIDFLDSPNEPGGYYYISGVNSGTARWCRGSGAEPLTFWEVEEVDPLEKEAPRRRR